MAATPAILMLGAFDTKGVEYAYARERLLAQGARFVAVNLGVGPAEPGFTIDTGADQVAVAAGADLASLRSGSDRGRAMDAMAQGVARLASQLHAAGRVQGVFGMGGSGGSSVITAAMRALPLGLPKVCLSTVVHGLYGASSMERLPVETAIAKQERRFRKVRLRG